MSLRDRPRGGLVALCIAETTSWGLLYYSLPVAVAPISKDTGWSHTAIMAALTVGLVVSAFAGIRVGRIIDVTGPRRIMTLGAILGVVALVLVAWSPNLPLFYLAWLLAGFAQSAVLYPPAFAVITRWYGPKRVKPLTLLTLVGGLASTIFAPLAAFLIDQFGWRTSYLLMAGILAVVTVPLHALFLNKTWTHTPPASPVSEPPIDIRTVTRTPRFIILQVSMALATFTLFAVTINIIPMMLERGATYSVAALTLGLIGVGQVCGRLGYERLAKVAGPRSRIIGLYLLGAAGLWLLAFVPGPVGFLVVVAVLLGAVRGCHTLLQATAVSDRWGTRNFGALNGTFTAPMTAVGALAPVAGPALAGLLGSYSAMAVVMGVLLTAAALLPTRS